MVFRDQIMVFSQPGAVPAEALESLINQVAELDMDEVRRLTGQQKSELSQS
jgi:thioredoxin 1